MNKKKIVIIGSSGFVGSHLAHFFINDDFFITQITNRSVGTNELYFDFQNPISWNNIVESQPDIIIDASGYGVVKTQVNVDLLYKINYLTKRDLIDYLFAQLPNVFWIQIGTAFEYSLEISSLTEESPCFPKTHYGISKCLFTNYLKEVIQERYCVVRPFGMFGEKEDITKFFPMLIMAQKTKTKVELSHGMQYRDYFYVKDLAYFLGYLIKNNSLKKLENQIVNVGSGKPMSLKKISEFIARSIPDFNGDYWNWGALPQRTNENDIFFNASTKAFLLGLNLTPLEDAFQSTVHHYFNS